MKNNKSKNKTTIENTVLEDHVISFETFRKVGSYEQSSLLAKEASCFNENVSIRKYKITIEPIEEPNEILAERLQKLWDECNNFHHFNPLKNAAKQIGYKLKGDFGSARRSNIKH